MNAFSWLRVFVLSLAFSAGTAFSARAAGDDFKIVAVRPFWSQDLIYVGKAWRKDLPKRIQVSLRVDADTPASSVFVKAYFYDKDDKLVGTSPAPNKIWTQTPRGIEEVGLPAMLPHVKTTDIYFAVTQELEAKKWTTVLVVFGNAGKVAASANPSTSMSKLDFPEKAQAVPASL